MMKNKIYAISFLLLIFWFIIALNSYMNSFNKNKNELEKNFSECIEKKEECDSLKEELDTFKLPSTQMVFSYILMFGDYGLEYLGIVAILFVIIPCIYEFYKIRESGLFEAFLIRERYKSFLIRSYKKSLKALLIMPLFLIVAFIITSFVTNFNFDYNLSSSNILVFTEKSYVGSNWILYLIIMLISLILHSHFYINLAYISFYKIKKFSLGIIFTYLSYIFVQVILVYLMEIILSIFININNIDFIYALEDPIILKYGSEISKYEYMIIASFIYSSISSIILFLVYKNKERFVINNEKRIEESN